MNDRMKETFGKIHAEEELKTRTREFILQKTDNYRRHKKPVYGRLIPVMACLLVLFTGLGGYRLYFTRTSVISIDINPSFELDINRFGRVISVNSYNDDGRELTDTLKIRFMDYNSAIDEILGTESIAMYLDGDEMLSISVAGRSEQESREMLADIETHVPGRHNICCHMNSFDEVDRAHAAGLSFGKYCAFLELQKTNPDITVEDVKGLTMREINDLMDEDDVSSGHRHRHGHGYGRQ